MMSKIALPAFITTLVTIFVTFPSLNVIAQTHSTEARPKIKYEGQYHLEREGQPFGSDAVKIFFADRKSFEDHNAHVYFEPVVYLETDKRGHIDHHIRDNRLLLYIRCEADRQFLDNAIRYKLIETAQETSKVILEDRSYEYRINPLVMDQMWLESRDTERTEEGPLKSQFINADNCAARDSIPVYFSFDTSGGAKQFLSDLQENLDQLLFAYTFQGISYDECTAKFSKDSVTKSQILKDLEGSGREGLVERKQLVEAAKRLTNSATLESECNTAEAALQLADNLMDNLQSHVLENSNDPYAVVDRLVELNKDDFAPDKIENLNETTKSILRQTMNMAEREAVGKADSESEGGGGAVGISGFMLAANANFSESTAENKAESIEQFIDILAKKGAHFSHDGEKFVPKSLDVFRDEDVTDAWAQDIEMSFRVPKERQSEKYRTSLALNPAVDRVSDVITEMAAMNERLEKRIEELENRFTNQFETVTRTVRQASEDVAGARSASRQARNAAQRAESEAEEAGERAAGARRSVRRVRSSVDARNYRLRSDLDTRREHYCTDVSVREFPAAIVTNVKQYETHDRNSTHHYWYVDLVENGDVWCIRGWNLRYDTLQVTVVYFGDELVGRSRRWSSDLRDSTSMRVAR